MATSRPRPPAWFGSRAHFLGSAAALAGVGLGVAEGIGPWTAAVSGGLYAAGAVLGLTFPGAQGSGSGPSSGPSSGPGEGEVTCEGTAGGEIRERPPVPTPTLPPTLPPAELAAQLRRELAAQRERVARAGWPEPQAGAARQLVAAVADRLSAATAVALGPVVRESLPGALDRYERARSWWRLEPQGEEPAAEFAALAGRLLGDLPPL
ncbi:hypothetical protein GCM10009665_13900 [Kitasatospora nipponensis]|uniref:Uncharacterized protein n=1 Tax=Kitasatospora nipponensis TaxID=258049 RepID=A0ABP4GGV8_9ACTN